MDFTVTYDATGTMIETISLIDGYANNEYMVGLIIGVLLGVIFWSVFKGAY